MSDIEKNNIAFGEIANALKSTASDHILGIAEDIYDCDLKKYQSEINSELLNKNFDDKYAPISHTHTKSQITDFAHTHDNVYKPLQTPVTDPADDIRPATMFISSITQDANGVISAAKKTVPIMTGATASSNGSIGLVPAPSARSYTSFLRGDGSWSEIPIYIGANMTTITDGISGLVPACPVSAATAFLRGDGSWTFPSTATTSTDGFMSAEDKTKLDDIFRKCTLTVELSSSVCQTTPIEFEVDEGESTSAPKIGEKFRVKIENLISTSTSIFMCASILQLKINDDSYYIKFYSDYDLSYDLSGVTYCNKSLLTQFPTNGYIEFGIFKTKANVSIPVSSTSSKIVTLYCAYLISNSYAGSISNLSYASIRTDKMNVYNAPSNFVSTYYLPVLQRGATGTTATNATPHTVWTDSAYYLSYDRDNKKITSVNAPSFISSGASVFSSYTNVTGIFDVKDTSNKNSVIHLNGSTSSDAPYINICKAGDESINAIKLTGSTSTTAPSISIKTAGAATESIKLTGSTSTTAPSISIKAKNSTSNGITLTGRNDSTAAKIVVYSGTGGTCTITGGSTSISSDERLKDFTNDIDIDFDKLKKIPKKYFTWKHDDEKVLNIGTSAQVVENVYPEIVDENLNEDEGTFYKSVDYSKLSIIALAAIDKLNERIEYLENKLKEYEQA